MLNLLRLRNGYGMRGLPLFGVGALVIARMVSMGGAKVMANPQTPPGLGLLVAQTIFSPVKNP